MTVIDNFDGASLIMLQPSDSKVPYGFQFAACSTASANDGSIPYGTSISSVEVTAYNSSDTDVTSTMISGTPTVLDDKIIVKLNWPGAAGGYKLTFVVTLDNDDASEIEFDCKKIVAKNI